MSASVHSGYDLFAEIYNRWMAEDFCRRALPVVDRLLLSNLTTGAPVLDLCCGSGQMARALSDRGFRVTGVDASAKMLQLARENAPAALFFVADARTFSVPHRCAACLSTFNSLAHIDTATELEQVFRRIRAALVDGAPLLFDLSMEDAYTSKWRGSFALVGDDHACILSPSYDPQRRIGRNDVTLFQRNAHQLPRVAIPRVAIEGDALSTNLWSRHDFCIEQRCHSSADVCTALHAAGFHHIDTYDAQSDLGMVGEYGRMFFLCS